ncbi:MAG: segregation/condensation protein A, partial [Deltaproteobacteria bacterium]|nr:segregation/condensation protein A [Deltaproteobacteria bacterium]
RDVFVRSSESRQKMAAGEIERLSLFDLLSAFRRVLERFPEEGVHIVKVEEISVQERMNLLLDCLRRSTRVVFQTLFEGVSSRMEFVVTFLALLELIKIRAIRATQEESGDPILIELTAPLGEEEGILAKRETEEEDEYGA